MRAFFACLLSVPILAGCVNDGVAYDINNDRQTSISILREQPLFWNHTVHFDVVLSRMPECTRRHTMGDGTTSTQIDVFQVPSSAYILKMDDRYFAAELETCEGFAEIKDLNEQGEPVNGTGIYRGRFHTQNKTWVFTKAQNLKQ